MDEVRLIPLADIIEPKTLLRLVDRTAIEYLEMRDSVQRFGFTSAISVRPARKPGKFEFIDGLHRYCIAQDLRLASLPCIIKYGVKDDDVLILQIQSNAQVVPTKPAEYARAIKQYLTRKPDMTVSQLATRLKKSPYWVGVLLGVLRLPEDVQKSVDRGEIPLISAYRLSRIPRRVRRQYVEAAKTMTADDFQALSSGIIKKYREAVRLGSLRSFYSDSFSPQPYLRNLKEIQAEVVHHQVGPGLLLGKKCHNPLDAFYLALHWVMHLDPKGIREQRERARLRERNQAQELFDADDVSE